MLTLDQNTLLRLTPNGLKNWLYSRCQLERLRNLLQRLRLATARCPAANDTITDIMGKIATEEANERENLRHILAVERAYEEAKSARKLRRIAPQGLPDQSPTPQRQDYSYLAFFTFAFWRKSANKA